MLCASAGGDIWLVLGARRKHQNERKGMWVIGLGLSAASACRAHRAARRQLLSDMCDGGRVPVQKLRAGGQPYVYAGNTLLADDRCSHAVQCNENSMQDIQ